MTTSPVEKRTVALLVDIYQQFQATNNMPEDKVKYFNGFVEASIMLGAYDPKTLDDLIDEANLEVFGMTLLERKKNTDYRDNPAAFDQPAYTRYMKASDLFKSE